MIVKHYSGLVIDDQNIKKSYELVKTVRETLKYKYSGENTEDYELVRHVNVVSIEPEFHSLWGGMGASIDYWINRLLARILQVTGGQTEEMVILDLGAGSTGGSMDIDGSPSNQGQLSIWNPWLCRALHELGAEVIGIDSGELSDFEPYEHYGNIDIMTTDLPKLLKRKDIDIIHSHALISSYHMQHKHGSGHNFFNFYKRFASTLFPQLEMVTRRNGIYILDDNPFFA